MVRSWYLVVKIIRCCPNISFPSLWVSWHSSWILYLSNRILSLDTFFGIVAKSKWQALWRFLPPTKYLRSRVFRTAATPSDLAEGAPMSGIIPSWVRAGLEEWLSCWLGALGNVNSQPRSERGGLLTWQQASYLGYSGHQMLARKTRKPSRTPFF